MFGKESRTLTWKDLASVLEGNPSSSGIQVNSNTALTLSSLFASIDFISNKVAGLPFNIFEKSEEGKNKLENPIYDILNRQPNPYQSAYTFRKLMTSWALVYGNAVAEIQRDNQGNPIALWPIPPDKINSPIVNQYVIDNLTYTVMTYAVGERQLLSDDCIHIMGFSQDGIWGKDIIKTFKDSIGLALAAEQHAASYYANGSTLNMYLSVPATMNDKQFEDFKSKFRTKYTGVSNAYKVPIYRGIEPKQLGFSPEESQFLETRQFQVAEIARLFHLPPHKLQDLSRSTFSNIESQNIEVVDDAIMPWLKRWESEVNLKCISNSTLFAEHLVEGLLRGDSKTRFDVYNIGRNMGFYSINDIRRMENMNNIPEGDTYLQPLNMQPVKPTEATPADPAETPQPLEQPINRSEVVKSHSLLLHDVAGRIVRREQKAVSKAIRNKESFEEVFKAQSDYMKESLLPVVRAIQGCIDSKGLTEIDVRISKIIDDYCIKQEKVVATPDIYCRGSIVLIDELVNSILTLWGNNE